MAHDTLKYGNLLNGTQRTEIGPAIDVTIENGFLYVIGSGSLFIASLEDPASPRIIGRCGSLGNVRQIEIHQGFAYITAREDGLYIVDIADPAKPTVAYHYDTLEKATGLAVSYPLAAVACRFHGVELIDISDPRSPKYIATAVPTKELQSVDIRNGYLYAGAWADRELVVVDIHDPRNPFLTNLAPLKGYGDGVRVKDGFVFAATGHHSPAFTKVHYQAPAPGEDARGFGEGHGIEIFDIARPEKPRHLSRLTMPTFYNGYPDMWGVEVSGGIAVLSDVYNGVFVIDVRDPNAPRSVGHFIPPAKPDGKPDAVAAAAIGNGYIYAAGYFSGLHVIEAHDLARMQKKDADTPVAVSASRRDEFSRDGEWTVYQSGGQVQSVQVIDDATIAAACGNAGVHILSVKPEIRRIAVIPTEDIAFDAAVHGDRLYMAEGKRGLSIWDYRNSTATLLGRYRKEKGTVNQVVVPPRGDYVLVQDTPHLVEIIDVRDPSDPKCIISDKGPGIFYGKFISAKLVNDRYAAVYWHMGGPVWYDMGGEKPVIASDMPSSAYNIINGMASFGNKLLILHDNGYSLVNAPAVEKLKDKKPVRLAGNEPINGACSVYGSVLFTANAAYKVVKAIDISDIEHPKLIAKMFTPGNPAIVAAAGDTVIIPDGRGGLRIAEKRSWFKKISSDVLAVNDIPLERGAVSGVFSSSVKRCSDRFTFDAVPDALIGKLFVSVQRGDKKEPGAGYSFMVNKDVTVYLFVMDTGDYALDWTKTALRAKWNFQNTLRFTDTVYKKDLPAGRIDIPAHTGRSGDGCGVPHFCVIEAR